MTEGEIERHDLRIRDVLRRAYDHHAGWQPVEDHTPLDELMAAEPEWDMEPDAPGGTFSWPSEQQPDLELQALKREEAAAVAAWAREQLVRWIAGDGMHPFRIVQRFFALCFARYGDLTGPLNGTALAQMLGQGRAAFSATMRELFGKPGEARLGVRVKVAGQKAAAAAATYAANARKHCPKRQLSSSGLSAAEEAGLTARTQAAAQARLDAVRAEADKRAIDQDAADLQRIISRAKATTNHPQNDHE
jgi:hypothetical protein